MSQLISIVGPTATGKTAFALWLAEKLSHRFSAIDLISVDSRQVYKGMEIGTGVDLPSDFLLQKSTDLSFPFWQKGKTRIHGLSFLKPNEEWSVTHFRNFAKEIVEKSFEQQALPILVGGTGLYHNLLFSNDDELNVKPNPHIRRDAEKMSVKELQNWLKKIDDDIFANMNHSDQMNSRRLVRKIEIGTEQQNLGLKSKDHTKLVQSEMVTIGLQDSIEHIAEKIRQRIELRFTHGMIDEVQKLVADYSDEEWNMPAFSATGYKEVRAFLESRISQEQMKELWLRREVQYAKRQMTWWKKQRDAYWVDVNEDDWKDKAEKIV